LVAAKEHDMNKGDMLQSLAGCIGRSKYQFDPELCGWPDTVNCYTLLIGAARVNGIDLPFGLDRLMRAEAVSLGKLRGLDLVLTTSVWGGFSWWDRRDIGHAYIVVSASTLIHACSESGTVVQVSASSVINDVNLFRAAVRLL